MSDPHPTPTADASRPIAFDRRDLTCAAQSSPSIGFITPIAPTLPGNGLAHRARGWQLALERVGMLTTALVPTHGPPCEGPHELVPLVAPAPGGPAPKGRGAHAPEWYGRRWAAPRSPFDAIVVLGADLAPFGFGVAAAMPGCRIVVDLDDDLVSFHRSRGDHATADHYAATVADVRRRADLVSSVTGFDGTEAIPNAVDIPAAALPGCSGQPGPPTVIMVGNYGYPPNVEGARWFAEAVWSRVTTERPDARLVLAGPGSEALPGGLGFVEDLADLYRRASVAAVPLLHGSGSRIKALEAFAHGVPVVGTTVGLDGLTVEHDHDCLLADDPGELAGAVLRVLGDPSLAARLTAGARQRVLFSYERNAVTHRIAVLVEQLLGSPQSVRYSRAPYLRSEAQGDALIVKDTATGSEHRLDPPASAVFLLAGTGAHPDIIATAAARAGDPPTADARPYVDRMLDQLCANGLLLTLPAQAHS